VGRSGGFSLPAARRETKVSTPIAIRSSRPETPFREPRPLWLSHAPGEGSMGRELGAEIQVENLYAH